MIVDGEKNRIMKLLQGGKISAEDAERLLTALGETRLEEKADREDIGDDGYDPLAEADRQLKKADALLRKQDRQLHKEDGKLHRLDKKMQKTDRKLAKIDGKMRSAGE